MGPVVKLNSQPHSALDQAHREKIMKWHDEQPDCSVSLSVLEALDTSFILHNWERSRLRSNAAATDSCGV